MKLEVKDAVSFYQFHRNDTAKKSEYLTYFNSAAGFAELVIDLYAQNQILSEDIKNLVKEGVDIDEINSVREFWSKKWEMTQEYAKKLSDKMLSPHVIYNVRVFKDGDKFCASLGTHLSDGLYAFGNTPEEACENFDKEWFGESNV